MIQSRNILPQADIEAFIQQSHEHLRNVFDAAFSAVGAVYNKVKEAISTTENNSALPLSDLTDYVDTDGCLNAPKYVEYLDKQATFSLFIRTLYILLLLALVDRHEF